MKSIHCSIKFNEDISLCEFISRELSSKVNGEVWYEEISLIDRDPLIDFIQCELWRLRFNDFFIRTFSCYRLPFLTLIRWIKGSLVIGDASKLLNFFFFCENVTIPWQFASSPFLTFSHISAPFPVGRNGVEKRCSKNGSIIATGKNLVRQERLGRKVSSQDAAGSGLVSLAGF